MTRAATCVLSALVLGGCQVVAGLTSAIGYNIEAQKKIEVLAKYTGLENQTCAVLAVADMSTMYEHPTALGNVMLNVAHRIQRNVSGAKVLDPQLAMQWQHQHPTWVSMPMSEVMRELDVKRLVVVDVIEYRLNPPGNRWVWEGVASANVGIAEQDGADPDGFVEEFTVTADFPEQEHLGRDSAGETQIETGLQTNFVQALAWLFYDHIEDKYPDIAH